MVKPETCTDDKLRLRRVTWAVALLPTCRFPNVTLSGVATMAAADPLPMDREAPHPEMTKGRMRQHEMRGNERRLRGKVLEPGL